MISPNDATTFCSLGVVAAADVEAAMVGASVAAEAIPHVASERSACDLQPKS